MIFQPVDAFRGATARRWRTSAPHLSQLRTRAYLRALAAPDDRRARVIVSAVARREGVERTCLDLLTPAARLLGEGWTQDTCSFVTVTTAMSRLQTHLRELERGWGHDVSSAPLRTALICATPGEQHVFGAAMLAGQFRRAGWCVASPAGATRADLIATVRRRRFDVIGLSMSCDGGLAPLGRLVADLRSRSLAADVSILVGGPLFLARPEAVQFVGADGTAADGPAAVALAEGLSRRLSHAA